MSLEQLHAEAQHCDLCSRHTGRKKVVVGDGATDARIVFIGERPGEREDRSGRPMTGPVGEYFNEMLAKINLSRRDVYVTNIVMCFSQKGSPSVKDMRICRKAWLDKILYTIDPVMVIAMGGDAVSCLTGTGVSVTQDYGKVGLATIPGLGMSYQLPVGVIANPAYIRKLNDYDEDSPSHWELWALQQFVMWVDTLAHEWYGDPIVQRGPVVLRKPSRIAFFPRVEPDDEDVARWQQYRRAPEEVDEDKSEEEKAWLRLHVSDETPTRSTE